MIIYFGYASVLKSNLTVEGIVFHATESQFSSLDEFFHDCKNQLAEKNSYVHLNAGKYAVSGDFLNMISCINDIPNGWNAENFADIVRNSASSDL